MTAEKLQIIATARAGGKPARQSAQLVGWSRAILYRHQQTPTVTPITTEQSTGAS